MTSETTDAPPAKAFSLARRDGPQQAAPKSRIRYVIVDDDSDEPDAETSNRSNPQRHFHPEIGAPACPSFAPGGIGSAATWTVTSES